jgi:hypothetical protein
MYEKKNNDLKLFVESRKKMNEVPAKKSLFGKAIEERNILIKSKEDKEELFVFPPPSFSTEEKKIENILTESKEDKEELFLFPPPSFSTEEKKIDAISPSPSVHEEDKYVFPPSQTLKSILVKRDSPEKEINEEDAFQDKDEFFFPSKKKK